MRFLRHEHADITTTLREHGIHPAQVLFVKRRGRLHVEVPGRPNAFVFFRKKSTRIDEEHAWEQRTDWFVGAKNEVPVDWRDVMSAFRSWLAADP